MDALKCINKIVVNEIGAMSLAQHNAHGEKLLGILYF
jgi:hypothetical protein